MRKRKKTHIEDRFWPKVEKTDTCWNWTAAQTSTGYGIFGDGYRGRTKMWKAHRLSYLLVTGEDPEGYSIDHLCHNTLCVNPSHLRKTTHKQNLENRRGANSNSSSGIRGVHWAKRYGKWETQIKHNGKSMYFGRYDTLEEAEAVVVAKRLELFTHNAEDRKGA